MEEEKENSIVHWVQSIENEHTIKDHQGRYQLTLQINDRQEKFIIPCHSATMYWLLCAKARRWISGEEFAKFTNSDASNCIKALLELAVSKKALIPFEKKMNLIPGAIIVFTKNDDPKHSCIAIDDNEIGGYNQVDWFTTPGGDHQFSKHTLKEFKWLSSWKDKLSFSFNKNRAKNFVGGNAGNPICSIWMIPPEIALEYVETLHG